MQPNNHEPWQKPTLPSEHTSPNSSVTSQSVFSDDKARKNPLLRFIHALSWDSLRKIPWRIQHAVIRRGGLFAIGAGLSCLLIITGVAAGALTILGYSPASVLTGHLTRIDQTDTNGTAVGDNGAGGGGTTGSGGSQGGGGGGTQGGDGGDGGGGSGPRKPGGISHQDNPAGLPVGNDKAVFAANACELSASSQDDPILYPGQPGAAHLHDFFGNMTTNAYSTTASLVGQASSCAKAGEPLDASAYWAPTMGVPDLTQPNGIRWIHAGQVGAYYEYGGTDNTPLAVQFPLGLRMIAGNSKGTTELNTDNMYFQCVSREDDTRTTGPQTGHIITCPTDYKLTGDIRFPDCWDGVWLYEANSAHMVYSGGSSPAGPDCPADHPIKLPELGMRIHWPFQGSDDAFLSSDLATPAGKQNHGRSFHADYWDAWDPGRLKKLIEVCFNSGTGCQAGGRGIPQPPPYETSPPPYTEGQEPYQGLGFDLTRPNSTQSFASVNTKDVACASQSWWQQLLSLFTRSC